ncbi:GAD-like domain-containing protein [Agrobacterium salinitolerans]|uniref:GAD-like domain-containing protein n=1 Tax=Agrobacterium salinitolerans TaxID=1183413 RepID=UPI0022B8240B|nr:GAD-like domain-containing protein [Agrobacterium salinitolerans]MCZ7856391.1 GAD-like domain-containing protein [Agrobacterium salinitolerans]
MVSYQTRLDAVLTKLAAGQQEKGHGPVDSEKYIGRIPESIFKVWDELGLGVFWNGYFQLCDPDKYRPIVDQVLIGDPDLDPERTHAIGFSAFGEMLAWNETHRSVYVALPESQVSCRWLTSPKEGVDPNLTILTSLLMVDDDSYDMPDENGRPLFKVAQSKLGELGAGQIYGFKPILAFGGPRNVNSLTVYDAFPHMSILAQAHDFELVDMTPFPPRPLRKIGN